MAVPSRPPPRPPPSGSTPQPAPSGPLTGAYLTATATAAGSIGPAFAAFSYEESSIHQPVFTASTSNLIGLFKRIGPTGLRVRGNTVDQTVRNPGGAAENARQVALNHVASPAAFVEAAGWQCLYGINLGGSATGHNSPNPRGPRGRLGLSAAWFLPALASRSATSPTSLATPEATTRKPVTSPASSPLTTVLPRHSHPHAITAALLHITLLQQGSSAPNLTATSGVTIQVASVLNGGTLSPSPAHTRSPSSSQPESYVLGPRRGSGSSPSGPLPTFPGPECRFIMWYTHAHEITAPAVSADQLQIA